MRRADEVTLGDIGRAFGRYRPFIAVLTGLLLVAVFLPGEQDDGSGDTVTGLTNQTDQATSGFQDQGRGPTTTTGSTSAPSSDDKGSAREVASSVGGTNGAGGAPDEPSSSVGGAVASAQSVDVGVAGGLNATCDENAGHLAIPSLAAPPCVEVAPNTGNDTRGVTGDTITIVRYLLQDDPASSAILQAAGADSSDEEVMQQVRDWVDYYTHHYETYGRDIELVFVKQSGESESAARSDAIKVAEDIGAFASINPGGTPAAYTDEVIARGVLCLGCHVSHPLESYHEAAPYSWGTLMGTRQAVTHRAEYIGKRLWHAGKKAEHAGDPAMHLQDRKFGYAFYNNGGQYEAGANTFERKLEEYGVAVTVRRDYEGFPKTEQSQQAARPIIQAMKEAGVTTFLCGCDPFAPIFFTQEATRQNYFPEWIVTGTAFTDTTLFGRTYDQQQWENAFGISQLTARVPETLTDSSRLLKWHFGEDYEPPADGYASIRGSFDLLFSGIHMAGPTLTSQTFEQGMFRLPPSGVGHISLPAVSFGGQLWPFNDYTANDDITMLWWDRTAQGKDELGNEGVGMYRYVDMGKRYVHDEQPEAPPKAFQMENTVTVYEDFPPGDRPPEYEHKDED